ncbi:MAG: class I SAM-dependent methyltransferase [Nanoarchaeota archaeon]
MSEGIELKNYSNYDDYISHQKSKAPHGSSLRNRLLGELWEPDCEGFRLNFKNYHDILSGCKNALCLGARTGQEVSVLKELGVDALGIDLVDNPPLVIEGDVHNLKFENESYDFIFSNIFDHVLHPDKFISEIERVLKPGGHCLLHLSIMDRLDAHSANVLHSSEHVIKLFNGEVEILVNKELGQPDWPQYWELMIKKIK